MAAAIKSSHLKRYKDVAILLMKYAHTDITKSSDLAEVFFSQEEAGSEPVASALKLVNPDQTKCTTLQETTTQAQEAQLIEDLENLGPTFVILGELLAKRPDLLPQSYRDALTNAEERGQALPISDVKRLIECEIGLTAARAFKTIESEPLSVSTLDQLHKATLTDGQQVVVKVQRTGVREQVYDDLEALDELAKFFEKHNFLTDQFDYVSSLEELRSVIVAQLDLRQEAHNLRTLRENLKDLDHIVVPAPLEQYCTSHMLTMTYVSGRKLEGRENFGLLKGERNRLAEQVLLAYLRQILIDGFVDATPSPSRVLITNDGKVAIFGLGIVVRIAPDLQKRLIQLLLAINEARADQAAEVASEIGEKKDSFDRTAFYRAVGELVLIHRDMSAEQIDLGMVLQGIARVSLMHGLQLPSEVAILATALTNLDSIIHILAPSFDTNAFIHKTVAPIMHQHMKDAFSPAHLFHTVIEATEFLEKLPAKFSRILDAVANNELKVTVHAIDEQVLMSGFQKIANRITVGLVLAALIIGASNLMHVPTSFTIGGYPGLAILCFLAAAGCGFVLVVEIIISDRIMR